jgi:flagellar biosynthesis protein FlhF
MRLKLYRSGSTADAMRQIRTELGPDALILSQRRVADGVEVTAALEDARPAAAPPMLDAAVIRGLAFHGAPADLAARLAAGPLAQTLAAALSFQPLALQPGDRPVLFAGPPGAGKTLTVARLATRLVMGGLKPLVITADGRRAGAAEQLAAFTRLLGLDLVVASHPVPMARALARRIEGAPVLIDMPGTSPFDPSQNEEMAALANVADARIAVVLPAGLDGTEARETAEAFAGQSGEYLVTTRLDVARRLGCVLAAGSAGLALAEAGIGPGAADGLVQMTADLLARRLLEVPKQWERRQ